MTDAPDDSTRRYVAHRRVDLPSLGLLLLSLCIAILVLSPLLWLVLRALTVEPTRAIELVASARTMEILGNSIVLMLGATLLSIALGVPLAMLTTRTDLPYPRMVTILAALPLVIPSYIGAFAFMAAFGPHGEVSHILGVTLPRFDGLAGATVVITLYTYPYVFLTTRAALLSIDGELLDAARTLNASRWRAFQQITWPQIVPAVSAGALLVALYALADFGTPAFMQVRVFTSAIYWEFGAFNAEYAALLSLQLLAVVGLVLLIEARIAKDPRTGASVDRGMQIELGYWKWPALAGVFALTVVTLLLPVAIFTSWLLRDTATTEIQSLAFTWTFAWNSVQLAVLAAVVASILALPVGYYAARSSSSLGRLAERGTYVGFAVPGIVIGLALVFFGANYAPDIFRTIPLLVFAYVVRFLPQAVGTTRAAVLQVDQQLIEAARTLDATRLETFQRVSFPLILPGIIAGGVLVFLTTMKELPATLLLRPVGMDTLVIIIWESHAIIAYRYAAIPALILILISGATMLVLLSQESSRMT